mmetsp:Transcript_7353/g.18446  ORF Transcript_7353/g.18446 Transcript_7353/m.18446 type:complete len:359 (-) Transcript_7353:118-1194(-)
MPTMRWRRVAFPSAPGNTQACLDAALRTLRCKYLYGARVMPHGQVKRSHACSIASLCLAALPRSFLSCFLIFFSPGGHRWQNLHPKPLSQPDLWKKAQGLHLRCMCEAEPKLGSWPKAATGAITRWAETLSVDTSGSGGDNSIGERGIGGLSCNMSALRPMPAPPLGVAGMLDGRAGSDRPGGGPGGGKLSATLLSFNASLSRISTACCGSSFFSGCGSGWGSNSGGKISAGGGGSRTAAISCCAANAPRLAPVFRFTSTGAVVAGDARSFCGCSCCCCCGRPSNMGNADCCKRISPGLYADGVSIGSAALSPGSSSRSSWTSPSGVDNGCGAAGKDVKSCSCADNRASSWLGEVPRG